jgi:hypothetical protein
VLLRIRAWTPGTFSRWAARRGDESGVAREYVLTGRRVLSAGCNGELSVAKWADIEFAALLIEKSTARTAFESLLAERSLPVDAAIDALPLDMEMRHALSKFRWAAARYEQWLRR